MVLVTCISSLICSFNRTLIKSFYGSHKSQCFYPIFYCNGANIATVSKSGISYQHNALGYSYRRQSSAFIERVFSYLGHAVGDGHLRQSRASSECPTSYCGHAVRYPIIFYRLGNYHSSCITTARSCPVRYSCIRTRFVIIDSNAVLVYSREVIRPRCGAEEECQHTQKE